MAGLVRDGALTTGHAAWPPTTVHAQHNSKVFAQSKLVVTSTDPITPHTEIVEDYETHGGEVKASTTRVFIKGQPAAQIGDDISCGDTLAESSNKVFIG